MSAIRSFESLALVHHVHQGLCDTPKAGLNNLQMSRHASSQLLVQARFLGAYLGIYECDQQQCQTKPPLAGRQRNALQGVLF
jgi:hypothetical protein